MNIKRIFFLLFLLISFNFITSCDKENENTVPTTPNIEYEKIKMLDIAKLIDQTSEELNSVFSKIETDKETNKLFVYVSDDSEFKYKATISDDSDNKIARISLLPEGNKSSDNDLFKQIVENSAKLRLGTFLGTKFINSTDNTGGLKQTVEETITLLNESDKYEICTLFAPTKNSRIAVYLNNSSLSIEFCRNYLPVDFSTINEFLGKDIDSVLKEYYEIANKLQFGTALSYLTFSVGVDSFGNTYDVNMDSDKSLKNIKEISIYIPEDDNTIERWKDLLLNKDKYKLGDDPQYYVNDSFGDKILDLNSPEEAIQTYNDNGRQYSILAKYKNNNSYNTLILNKDFCYILTTKQ